MNLENQKIEPFPFATACGVLAVMTVVPTVTVSFVMQGDVASAAILTAEISLLIAIAAQLPVWLFCTRSVEGAPLGFVMGTMARMALTLIVMIAFMTAGKWEPIVIVGWMIGWYFWLLIAEVALMVRYLKARRIFTASREDATC